MPKIETPLFASVATPQPLATAPAHIAGLMPVVPSGLASPGGLVSTSPSRPTPLANAVIPGTNFRIIDRPKRKAVILCFGDGGTGKTSFGLVFTPQPAVLIGFDGRSEFIEETQKNLGRPIPAVQIAPPSVLQKSDNVKAAAREALREFFLNYDGAIEASKTGLVRTIVIDTGSELGEIITLSVRGTLENVKGDYGRSKDQINQIWWKIFGAARFTGNAHLVILARASAIWENNEPTGDFRARVSDTVRDAVDFSLHIRLGAGAPPVIGMPAAPAALVPGAVPVPMAGMPGAPGAGLLMPVMAAGPGGARRPKEFELVVKKSGNKNPLEKLGEVYRQSDWGDVGPFAYACAQLMPGTTPDDWR